MSNRTEILEVLYEIFEVNCIRHDAENDYYFDADMILDRIEDRLRQSILRDSIDGHHE